MWNKKIGKFANRHVTFMDMCVTVIVGLVSEIAGKLKRTT